MSVYCISDLHLGDRGPRDCFPVGGRELRFNEFLDMVGDNQLFLLGDVFDWWQVNLGRSLLAYRSLLTRLGDMDVTWVLGNHDNAIEGLRGTSFNLRHKLFHQVRPPFVETIGGRSFRFMHGHEADPYCSDSNPGKGAIAAVIAGLRKDRRGAAFDNQGRSLDDRVVGPMEAAISAYKWLTGQPSRLVQTILAVEDKRLEDEADVVVYGHTHAPGWLGDYHYNCGTWARKHDTFVRIDDAGVVTLLEWTHDGAMAFNRDLAHG